MFGIYECYLVFLIFLCEYDMIDYHDFHACMGLCSLLNCMYGDICMWKTFNCSNPEPMSLLLSQEQTKFNIVSDLGSPVFEEC